MLAESWYLVELWPQAGQWCLVCNALLALKNVMQATENKGF